MGKFSKIFHHIESKDLRNKYEQKKAAKIKEEKKKEDTKKYIASVMEQVKYDWRSGFDIGATLREGMTTSDVAVTKQVDAAPGDGDVSSLDAIDASSYTPTIGVLAANDDLGANVGTQIRASGSGSGQDGGFNVGGNYLAFQGTGTGAGNARFAVLSPVDSTEIDTLKIKAIVGNDSNGGEDPDAVGEELYVMYKTRAMPEAMFLIQKPDGSIADGVSGTEDMIIPIGAAPNAGLNDYSVTIPDYARAAGTQFILIQANNSGVGFDNYGVTEIKFQRKAPITVFVPLDNPEASSFIRSAPEGSTPKKRKKDVNDKLEASDQYTQAKFGNEFPGQEVRVGGEDPFKGAEIGDDVEPSPQSKDEVRKSFSKFSDRVTAVAPQTTVRGAPTAEPEAEPVEDPEVIATTQSKTATNDDGEPIEPKPVAAGAVQGADATNLDQDEPTEPEPTEPEPTSPDQEETEQELETEPDVEDKSEEELNQQLEDKTNALEKALTFQVTRDLNGFKNLVKVSKFAVQGFLGMLTIADRLNPFKQQNTETNDLQGGLSVLLNSLDIAMSVMDGKISKSNPTAAQINTYKNSILPSLFKSDINNTIPISDVRHEYADGNIYVERIDGKAVIRDNTGGIRQDLTVKDKRGSVGGEYAGFGQVGGGYSQFIIPKDGGEPYIHFYDYNYHNINNDIDVSFEGGIIQSGGKVNASTISASLSNLIHQLRPSNTKLNIPARAKTSLIGYFTNFKDVLSALQTTSTLEGWPPGIHGAALTDITIPLSQLPKETQEMMAKHPLSWTPERIENMSDEQLYGQVYPLIETDEQFEYYMDFTSDITKMSTEPVNTVPFAVAMQEMDEVYEQYENDLLEKYGEDGWEEFSSGLNRETSEFFAAERAAYEDLETLESEEQKERDENDRIRGFEAQGAVYDKLVKPLFDSVKRTLDSGGTVSKATMDRLDRQYEKYKKQTDKMEKEYFKIQRGIFDKYQDLREPIENIAYGQLFYLREPVKDSPTGQARYKIKNRDGDESSGADYTALDGTVYKGKNTYFDEYYNGQENFSNQMNALYEPVADLQRYVDGAFVKEGIAERFEKDYGFSSENWSPKNKGGKSKPKSKPDPRASFAGTGADAGTFAFDGTPDKDKDKDKNKNEELLLMYARPQPRRGLFEKVKSKGFFNQNDIKPIFPENPPPKLDPKTGMHPQYGKKAARFKKLDPISANSMPLTGDPETDAIVKKQKTINKIKKMAKKNLKESDFTNITQGNKVGQTFQHTSGATITLDGALGGKMMVPSQVTLSLPFGEGDITVDGPNESDFALTGFTKPLDFKLQKRIADQSKDEINDKLDASEKASGAETAKVEGEGDIWTWTEYMNQLDALSDRYAKMAEPLEKVKLDYINKNEDVPIGIIDKIDAITQALHKAQEALHQKWLAYNKIPEPQGGFGGGQGNPTNRRGSGFDTQGALDSSAYGMDPSRDTETEARPVSGDQGKEGISSDDIKFLNKQQTLVNLTKGLGAIGLPNDFAQWTINYAKGDMKPITKFSPGMEKQVRNLVLDKFKKNPNAKTVDIQYGDYGFGAKALPTRLGLGRFNATKLDNGKIRIQDTFNVDKDFTTIGFADIVPGLQKTADRLVDISYKTRNIKGRTDEGGIKIDVLIDSGFVKKKRGSAFDKIKKIRNK